MNDIFTKSQELLDEFFDSISDEEFLNNYLAVEQSKGPLIKDYSFFDSEVTYTVTGQLLDLDAAIREGITSKNIHAKKVVSYAYESTFPANDENYFFGLAA